MAESDDIQEARLGGFLVKHKGNDGDSQAQTKAETRGTAHIDPFGIDFVSMAMFIIGKSIIVSCSRKPLLSNDIEFLPPTPPVHNVPGGAGTYAALGARLMSPPPLSSSIGWIVDVGTDFPPHLTTIIDAWETSVVLRPNEDRLTTRAWNGYKAVGKRDFKYMTPKRRINAEDLTPALLRAKSFHLVCSPARCQEIVSGIKKLRKQSLRPEEYVRPFIIWEPVPDKCTPEELLACTNTLPVVDICSPNHTELAGFMGDDGLDPITGEISTASVERHAEQLLASLCLQSFTLVVRAAEKGCYIARNGGRRRRKDTQIGLKRSKKELPHGGLRPDIDMEALFAGLMQDEDGSIAREEIEVDPGVERWIPAYHQDPARVVDPTGGGNAFLGGLSVALARGKSIEEAAVWGTIAASFVIEQVGLPVLEKDQDGHERWNGVRVDERFKEFRQRLEKQGIMV